MARRTFGNNDGVDNVVISTSLQKKVPQSIGQQVAQNKVKTVHVDEKESVILSFIHRMPRFVIPAVCGLFLVCAVSLFFILRSSHDHVHASGPDDMATIFVNAVLTGDTDTMEGCLPDFVIEKYGTGSFIDDINGTYYRSLVEEHELSNAALEVVALDEQDLPQLINSCDEVYGVQPKVKEAVLVRLSGTLSYSDGFVDDRYNVYNCSVMVCRIGFGWYVIPGLVKDISAYGFSDYEQSSQNVASDMSLPQPGEDIVSDTGIEDVEEQEPIKVEYHEEIVKPVLELDKYERLLDDLKSGKVNIDGIDYQFPEDCDKLSEFVTLDYDNTGLSEYDVIDPNFIMNGVPVRFKSDTYDMVERYFAVGNMTDEQITVGNGKFTTVYLGYPKSTRDYQIYDYPTVYLPGNVTFGTPLDDVIGLYGNSNMDKCHNLNELPEYDKYAVTYQIVLGDNIHNHLYLQFLDNKLVGMEWYYFDFNDY